MKKNRCQLCTKRRCDHPWGYKYCATIIADKTIKKHFLNGEFLYELISYDVGKNQVNIVWLNVL